MRFSTGLGASVGAIAIVALAACGSSDNGSGGKSDSGTGGKGGAVGSGGHIDHVGGAGGSVSGGTGATGGTTTDGGGAAGVDGGSDASNAYDAYDASDASDANTSLISAAQACDDYAAAYCALIAQCEPFHVDLWFGDAATCKSRMALPCLGMLGDAGTTWNGDRMEACAQAVTTDTCGDWYVHTALAACSPPPGALPDSAPCKDGGQCQSTHCLVPSDSFDGTCAPAPDGSLDPCYFDDDCATGSICDQALYGYETYCHQVVGSGAICKSNPCAKNLDCIPDSCTICPPEPTCKPPDGVWYTCTNIYAAQCDDLQGLTCGSSGVCAYQTVAAIGASCDAPLTLCAANAVCTPQSGGGSICVAVPDGGSCDGQNGPLCMPPARCVGGTCQI